jgi:lysophospholipase L1-like esterase
VAEQALLAAGLSVRVFEDCLNGRRTAWDDPFKPGRNGRVGIEQRIESHSPLALVILLIGANDFQSIHQVTAWHSAQGVAALVAAIRLAPIEPGMPVPGILVVAPPPFRAPKGAMAQKFEGAVAKSEGFAAALREVASMMGCAFFDAGTVATTSAADGVHLDADQHRSLGRAIARVVADLLPPASTS